MNDGIIITKRYVPIMLQISTNKVFSKNV